MSKSSGMSSNLATIFTLLALLLFTIGIIVSDKKNNRLNEQAEVVKTKEERVSDYLKPVYDDIRNSISHTVQQINLEKGKTVFEKDAVVFTRGNHWLKNPEAEFDDIVFVVPDNKPLLNDIREVVNKFKDKSFPFKRCVIHIDFDRDRGIFNGVIVAQGQYDNVMKKEFTLLPFILNDVAN